MKVPLAGKSLCGLKPMLCSLCWGIVCVLLACAGLALGIGWAARTFHLSYIIYTVGALMLLAAGAALIATYARNGPKAAPLVAVFIMLASATAHLLFAVIALIAYAVCAGEGGACCRHGRCHGPYVCTALWSAALTPLSLCIALVAYDVYKTLPKDGTTDCCAERAELPPKPPLPEKDAGLSSLIINKTRPPSVSPFWPDDLDKFRQECLNEHNAKRQSLRMPPLALDATLNAVAQDWAEEMAKTSSTASRHATTGKCPYSEYRYKHTAGMREEKLFFFGVEMQSKTGAMETDENIAVSSVRAWHESGAAGWPGAQRLGVGAAQRVGAPPRTYYVAAYYDPPTCKADARVGEQAPAAPRCDSEKAMQSGSEQQAGTKKAEPRAPVMDKEAAASSPLINEPAGNVIGGADDNAKGK